MIGDDAVADADAVVEAGENLAPLGGLDPEAEPADLDGFLVEIHAVEVVLQDLPVEIEKRPRAPEFFQPVVRPLVGVVELLERLDQERPAAAGGVEQLDGREFVLPEFPEADEGRPLGSVERVEVVDAGIGEYAAGGAFGLLGVLAAEGFEAVLQDAAEGLADDVAGDEGRRVERAFLLAAAGVLGRGRAARSARPARCGAAPGR